jgi:hypothetical protein
LDSKLEDEIFCTEWQQPFFPWLQSLHNFFLKTVSYSE